VENYTTLAASLITDLPSMDSGHCECVENYYLHWTLTHRCWWVRTLSAQLAIILRCDVIVRRHLRGVREVIGTFLLGVNLDLLLITANYCTIWTG